MHDENRKLIAEASRVVMSSVLNEYTYNEGADTKKLVRATGLIWAGATKYMWKVYITVSQQFNLRHDFGSLLRSFVTLSRTAISFFWESVFERDWRVKARRSRCNVNVTTAVQRYFLAC